jgi:hypothetical protein
MAILSRCVEVPGTSVQGGEMWRARDAKCGVRDSVKPNP